MNSNKLDSLTWLRGFAAFFVILNHVILVSRAQYTPQDETPYLVPFDFFNIGMFAVYLFFALSGCTLTISHAKKINTFSDFIPFYIKRFFRIWPAFAVSMVIYLLYIEVFKVLYVSDKNLWVAEFLKEYTIKDVFGYLSLTFNITGPRGLFNGPYWSLPVEFQYYLLLPFALILMKNRWTNFLVPLIFGVVLYVIYCGKLIVFDRNDVFKMGFAFFGGVLIAKYYTYISYKIPLLLTTAIFLVTSFVMGLLANRFVELPDSIPIINDGSNIYGICSVLIVGLALITKPIENPGRFLNFLTFYGEISYSTYLFHMMFIGAAGLIISYCGIHSYMNKLIFSLFFTLIGSYFFSVATYYFIEKPSIDFGARLVKK